MNRNLDFYGPHGEKAVIYASAARRGTRIEIGLQVWNPTTALWQKQLCTHLLPEDNIGIYFELERLVDKAQAAGYTLYQKNTHKQTTPGATAG